MLLFGFIHAFTLYVLSSGVPFCYCFRGRKYTATAIAASANGTTNGFVRYINYRQKNNI